MRYTAGRFSVEVFGDLSGVRLELNGWNDAVRPAEMSFQPDELEDAAYVLGRALKEVERLIASRRRPTNGA